jgi:hypothetical protein
MLRKLLMAASPVPFGLWSGVEPDTQGEPARLGDGGILPRRPAAE